MGTVVVHSRPSGSAQPDLQSSQIAVTPVLLVSSHVGGVQQRRGQADRLQIHSPFSAARSELVS